MNIETPKIPGGPQGLETKLSKAESALADAEAALADAKAKLESAGATEHAAAIAAASGERAKALGAASRTGAELVRLRHALANHTQVLSDARAGAERAAAVVGERARVSVPYLSALCIEFAAALRTGATEQIHETPSVHTSSASELEGMVAIANVTERVLPPAA